MTSKLAGGTQSLSSQRQRLPIYKQRSRLLNLVERYGVLVVVGQTVRRDDPSLLIARAPARRRSCRNI